jgi:hypothetical protein
MLSFGNNIKQKNDKLSKIDINQAFAAVAKAKQELQDLIAQLRILTKIDPAGYRNLKTHLPYFVPSLFNPPFRKNNNFASSEHIILDFDHLADYDIDPQELKDNLKKDKRIQMMFISPSQNGLKIFFKLSEKFYDTVKYSLFYKNFALDFAKQYNIDNVLDSVTSDVSRACFLSYDKFAFLNNKPEPLVPRNFVDFDDIFLLKDAHKIAQETQKNQNKIDFDNNLNNEMFSQIKQKLNPKIKAKIERKNVYVPEKLENIIPEIIKYIENFDLQINEVISINYGKKIIANYNNEKAEINVFYGKRGFSVVRSPKTGTNKELMELLFKIVQEFFNK